jgi:deoxycytidine triphosphate deaminase
MLNNVEIARLIETAKLIANHEPERIQPASYDLTIGSIFRGGQIINGQSAAAADPIVIAPGEVVTMLTREELSLPADICGTAYAMNAQSSEGLLVLNPGHVDPGYKGPLSVVALNLRKVPLALQLGDAIFTIVFSRLEEAARPPYSGRPASLPVLEKQINKKVVEKSIGSLAQLLSISEKDINALIRGHWLSWIAMSASVIAAVASVVAALFAVLAVLPTARKESTAEVSIRELPVEVRPTASAAAGTKAKQ